MLGEVKQALLAKDELDRERARFEIIDTKASAHREFAARMFGSIEQRLENIEQRVTEIEKAVGRRAK